MKILRQTAFQTIFSMGKHKNYVMGNRRAERLFCLCETAQYNLWWAGCAAIGASAEQQASPGSYFAISQSQE